MENDDLLFTEDDQFDDIVPIFHEGNGWKILIVDDESEMHQITKLALVNFTFEDRNLIFIHAYSAEEALEIFKVNPDIALTLLDVVMETNHAGLDLVKKIREDLNNYTTRIVLRTGQPGEAPERDIIANYDINDYAEKAELSAQKLTTLVIASLRAYRDILKLEDSRKELILANQDLAEQAERIQVTLDSIGDAVITTDAEGKVTHLNSIAEKLTGWQIKDALSEPLERIFNIVNASSRLPVENPVNKVLTSGTIIGLANHTVLISKNGDEYQIADSAAPIRGGNGDILGVILVCRDVTQEYQTEEALRRSQKMEVIGQLTGGIAHDFNNQLGVIIGYLDLISDEIQEDTEVLSMVNTCTKATLRCTDLTRQLLSFSRKRSNETSVTNINTNLSSLQTMFSRSVTPAIEIQYALSDDVWLSELNEGEFQDAALNLVINAKDAMPKGGTLIIETANKYLDEDFVTLNPGSQTGEYVQIIFSDTGLGMDNVTQEKIFEPFYSTKPSDKGTGLGMSMVYGFMKRFGGFIKIYSELNVGSSICLYLPRSTELESTIDSQEYIIADVPRGKETVLIVDDEVDLLELANKYLIGLGYKTYQAKNAEQAMDIFSKNPDIDCLFSDVVMPGEINGYDLADTLLQQKPQLKVLLSSGFTSKVLIHKNQIPYKTDMLHKPYRKEDLAQRLRYILDKKSGE